MAKRRQRRRAEKDQRRASSQAPAPSARDLEVHAAVKRLACTRKQAAEALGVSLATLDRRVIPAIETVRTEWGSRLIPVAELERYLDDRKQQARTARRRPSRPGRRPGVEPDLVARIQSEYASGRSHGELPRSHNADGDRPA